MKKSAKGIPPAPAGLSRKAKDWWQAILTEWTLDAPGLLVLESAMRLWDRAEEAAAIVNRDGPLLVDRFGQVKKNPASDVERDARRELVTAMRALGLQEQAPGRIGRPPATVGGGVHANRSS